MATNRPRSIRSAARIVATTFFCLMLVSVFSIQLRYSAAVFGFLPVPQANAYEHEGAASQARVDGPITVSVDYTSEVVAGNDRMNPSGLTSTQMTFDDAWLRSDSHTYNHDLATACAVLSAVVNSESQFYGSVDGAVPYAEKALSSLGFDNVRTESFALRSHVLDQIGALFAGSHDVAAYAFASKTLEGADGEPDETLIFVGIRGSYGIEWLSNFNLAGGEAGTDHQGFKRAESEIAEALEQYAKGIGADPDRTRVLVTGHSRGGAVANLLAADLDDRAATDRALARTDGVYAYTFAAPGSTQSIERNAASYGNIFNVANPSDIVPKLPLFTWGYGHYGATVELPDVKDSAFSREYEAMQAAFQANTGYANPCCSEDLGALDSFDAKAAETVPSLENMLSIEGVVGTVQALAGIDYPKALAAHYPDTYIAWMQTVDSRRMTVA